MEVKSMSYNITCPFMQKNTLEHIQIQQDGTVWSCCKYSQAHEDVHGIENGIQVSGASKIIASDVILQAEFYKDAHWNDLNYHELDDILENHIFKKYIAPEGWNSENPPLLCKTHCSNK